MWALFVAALGFVGIHLGISGTPARAALVRRLGDGLYMGLYSVASLVFIAWLSRSYNTAVYSADNTILWIAPTFLSHLGGILMLIATLLVVIGVTTPSITSIQAGPMATGISEPKGIQRITRHPFLWGVLLWSVFHLIANGDVASVLLFGTFLVVTALGTRSIDSKRAQSMGPAWADFAAKTSNVPFAAILQGRNRLALGEIAWWQWLAAIVVFLALFYGHLWLFSVSPVPGWAPY